MKRHLSLLLIVAVAVFPVYAFADCPGRTCVLGPGPQGANCPTCYYSFDTSCPTITNAFTVTNMSCYSGAPGVQFYTGSGTVDWHMIVPTGHGGSCTTAQIHVDFNDPSGHSTNTLTATVYVTRGVGPVYSSTFFSHNGSQGQLTCPAYASSAFTVQEGDRIDVEFDAYNDGNATIAVATPLIWGNVGS